MTLLDMAKGRTTSRRNIIGIRIITNFLPLLLLLLPLSFPTATHSFLVARPPPTTHHHSPVIPPPQQRLHHTTTTIITHGQKSTIKDDETIVSTINGDNTAATTTSSTTTKSQPIQQQNDDDAFSIVAALTAQCIIASDLRRDAMGTKNKDKSPSGASNWIDEESLFVLRQAVDRLSLKLPDQLTGAGLNDDIATKYLRWMKSTPSPLRIDLSPQLRSTANTTILSTTLNNDLLHRLSCHLLLLPSGTTLSQPLTSPNGSILIGKLIYGGVTRFRLLSSSDKNKVPRRIGDNRVVMTSLRDRTPGWIQYGGPDRNYESVDMGAAAVLEIGICPSGRTMMDDKEEEEEEEGGNKSSRLMVLSGWGWNPRDMFRLVDDKDETEGQHHDDNYDDETDMLDESTMTPGERNNLFRSTFTTRVGGLQPQIDTIIRRVLDGRIIRPASPNDDSLPSSSSSSSSPPPPSTTTWEADELALLGLTPVRGLLLYGPPGCGKTALARDLSLALRARTPKIIAAPELLDRWVGGSERLVRDLFADAKAELAAVNGDARRSALHVVVIDEIDAVFRKRTGGEESGEATRSSVVNQILAILDGVEELGNVLVVGMTNRRELLDEALLRPGRLEVQIEIPKPDREGRREILGIHFGVLRRRGRLSQPLCEAIDGVLATRSLAESTGDDDSSNETGKKQGRKRRAVKRAVGKLLDTIPSGNRVYDLASDSVTGGFSGADIAGLVRCAGSIALARARTDGGGVENLLITLEDVKEALEEVKK